MGKGDNFAPNVNRLFLANGEEVHINDYLYYILKSLNDRRLFMPTIKTVHEKIHDGVFFDVCHKITIDAESTINIAGKTNNKYVHFVGGLKTSIDNVDIAIYEDTVYTEGSNLRINSHNRNYNNNTGWSELKHTVNISQNGNEFFSDFEPGASGVLLSYGGNSEEREEWVLKPNTTYSIIVTNNATDANTIYLYLNWYTRDTL